MIKWKIKKNTTVKCANFAALLSDEIKLLAQTKFKPDIRIGVVKIPG
jgi:hypothetical protein